MSKRRFPGIHQLPLVIIKLSSAVRAKTGEGQLHYMALHLGKVHQWKKCISSWTHQSFSSIPLISFKPPCFMWRAIKHERYNSLCTKVIKLTSHWAAGAFTELIMMGTFHGCKKLFLGDFCTSPNLVMLLGCENMRGKSVSGGCYRLRCWSKKAMCNSGCLFRKHQQHNGNHFEVSRSL